MLKQRLEKARYYCFFSEDKLSEDFKLGEKFPMPEKRIKR